MGPKPTLTPGMRFGRLRVLSYAGESRWNCECECGRRSTPETSALTRGITRACGCLRENNGSLPRHGHGYDSPTYRTWAAMKRRCRNRNCNRFARYGGRGITVCERWQDFENFLADMGERPDGRTLDRIDNDGNYEPGNCRWATLKEQANNRKR